MNVMYLQDFLLLYNPMDQDILLILVYRKILKKLISNLKIK